MKHIIFLLIIFLLSGSYALELHYSQQRLWFCQDAQHPLFGLRDVHFKSSGLLYARLKTCTLSADGATLTYDFPQEAASSLSATVSRDATGFCVSFDGILGPEVYPQGAMLSMVSAEGVSKKFVEKYGKWNRCEAAPEWGEPFETFGIKLKMFDAPSGRCFWEVTGNENWFSDVSEHLEFTMEPTSRRIHAQFHVYAAEKDTDGFEIAAMACKWPFGLQITSDKRNNIWVAQEPHLKCVVKNATDAPMPQTAVSMTARDYDGTVVASWTVSESFRPFEKKSYDISIPISDRNLFFIECKAVHGQTEMFTRTTAAVLPPYDFRHRSTSPFGINFRCGRIFKFEQDEEIALLRRLGIHYLRGTFDHSKIPSDMTPYYSVQCPQMPYNPSSSHDVGTVGLWLDDIERSHASIFELGNEIGHHETQEVRHKLYDAYLTWLNAVRDERARRKLSFDIIYGTSSKRPELMQLIQDKGIFALLDGFVVHPGRLSSTPDFISTGWSFRGLVQGSKKTYDDYGFSKTPLYLTEVYVKTPPNDIHSDSYRQAAENAVLTAAYAMAEQVRAFNFYQLHEGRSYDENGINPEDSEYHYGILHRDNAPKPSFMGIATAAEELDGATFISEIQSADPKDSLRGLRFDTPRGPLALLFDRSEGTSLQKLGFHERDSKKPFFHYEPWLSHWRVKKEHVFSVAPGKSVTVIDPIGRRTTIVPSTDGTVTLKLSGEPLFVYGLQLP